MIHTLLVLAVIFFVLWLLFHAVGALVNLLWIAILVALVLWVIGAFVRGARSTTGR
ncbi:MAG TPA: hydrophobic protein [Candidatus Dormibacteraeota bacterium]|nr:hydrophobic protein [Candidatus Dormibacteraeota bacterium]